MHKNKKKSEQNQPNKNQNQKITTQQTKKNKPS